MTNTNSEVECENAEYRDALTVTLTEHWERQYKVEAGEETEDYVLLLTLSLDGEEVAGAIYDPGEDSLDTDSDGCGLRCDADSPAYWPLNRMDADGDWPSPPDVKALDQAGEWTGILKLEVCQC